MRFWNLLFAVLLLGLAVAAGADEAKLRCIADTSLSSYESEQEFNYGRSSHLRLKGVEMLALFEFDLAPVRGWKVRKATLYLRYGGADQKLRTLGFSTVGARWQEGTGSGEKKENECCFLWSALGETRWAGPNTDFTDVSFTAGHTLAAYADVKELPNGWLSADVDPRLVQAQIAGVSYGLAVSDEKGQTRANNDVYSREQAGSEPYLVVEGVEENGPAPAPIARAEAVPDSGHADFTTGAVRLTFTAPPNAFAYNIYYAQQGNRGVQEIARSLIPFAVPGQKQSIVLPGFKPSAQEILEVAPISATGVHGKTVEVKVVASPAKVRPAPLSRPPVNVGNAPEPPLRSGRLRVWAYPDTEKADPVSGNLLEEVGQERYGKAPAGAYRNRNAVWEGQKIRLSGARNEFVGFHLLVEATAGNVHGVALRGPDAFQSAAGGRSWKPRAGLYRDWYVKDGNWFPEICVPLAGTFDIPAADNAVPGQRNQSICCDLLIPRDTAPGVYNGVVTVSADGVPAFRVPVELTVNALTLPDTLSFDVSLNTYGTLGGPFGLDDRTPEYRSLERAYHRLAHLHRATLAPLGYSQSGNLSGNYAPPLEGSGPSLHVKDWTAWDAQFGAYLDGSAFADLPRKGVPLTHFYLPFHEAWPVDIRAHYNFRPSTTDYPALITEHALKAPPVAQAFDREFGEGFTAVVKDFAAHFAAKGWKQTGFQFYLNDKYDYKNPKMGGRGTSWWLLDEPNHRDDWLALAYFDRLFGAGTQAAPGARMLTREDVSRPQWQRNYLDGLVDLMVVSGELYNKGPRLREMREQWAVRFWNYGTANAVRRSNTEAEGWAVRAWLAGADGIVPWQSVGTDANFTRPEETALLLPGKRFRITGPVASLRLKALRRAQQDAEYLVLLGAAKHWDREQIAAALDQILTAKGRFQQANAADAGSLHFDSLHAADFTAMRQAIALLLR